MPRPWMSKAEDWTLTPDEAMRLTRKANELDTPWLLRKRYDDDPEAFIRLHKQAGCRVWHKDVGNIGAPTPWVEPPHTVLDRYGV